MKTVLVIALIYLTSLDANANEKEGFTFPVATVSHGKLVKNGEKLTPKRTSLVLSQSKSDQQKGIAKNINRDSVIQMKLDSSQASVSQNYPDFEIFDAESILFDDYDGDGYFSTFSVTFDADVYGYYPNSTAKVYAELYLSKNGGSWVHYFTTDAFFIQADDSNDEYEVVTTLETGYRSEHYDVLIDLYEVGYSSVVATYSSYDTDALYALPLESAEYDQDSVYTSSISYGYAGNMSQSLWLLLAVFVYRTFLRIHSN